MKRTTKSAKRIYTPTAEQWNAETLTGGGLKSEVQFWTAGGTLGALITLDRAKDLVRAKAAFVGAPHYICQVHDGIKVA